MKYYVNIARSKALYDAAAAILESKGYKMKPYCGYDVKDWCVKIHDGEYWGDYCNEARIGNSGFEEISLAELVTELPAAPSPIFTFALKMTAEKTEDGVRFVTDSSTFEVSDKGMQTLGALTANMLEVCKKTTWEELVSLVHYARRP
jgi:hypothetical protein